MCDYRNMADEQEWSEIGERVKRARIAAGVSQSDLADAVGLDRTMIAKVEAGRRRLDAFELGRVSSKLSVPMRLLVESRPYVLSHRAVQLTEDNETDVTRTTEQLDVVLASWIADIRQLVSLGVLKLPALLPYPGVIATAIDARSTAMWVRTEVGLELAPIETLMSLCEKVGQLVLVTTVPGDGASAIADDIAASVVSVTGDPGRRRATAAHELGHLLLGDEYSSDLGIHASRSDRESVVDAFAAQLLLPTDALIAGGADPSRETLVRFAALYKTSWSLALKQAELAGLIDSQQRRRLNQSKPTRVELSDAVGWAPQPDLDGVRVPPSYAHAVVAAWRQDLVTTARAVELMHGQISADDLEARDGLDIEP